MADTLLLDELFFNRTGMGRPQVQKLVEDALAGADDGELFLEYAQLESLAWDDGKLKNASFNTTQGFGLRSVLGEASAYAHASELSEDAIRRAASTARAVHFGQNGVQAAIAPAFGTNTRLYDSINPLKEVPFEEKLALLERVDSFVRAKDPRVKQVSVSLSGHWQAVRILRADGS
ncbi:MAG: metalloprotease TldD, partial [Proteobacteria bacterium]|nr:metalloprotease TldD [Pseudomonadota bacterium]